MSHLQDADDRHVAPSRRTAADAEMDDVVVAVEDLAPHAVERLVLDEDDRVVVADRRLQQALGVGGRRRAGDEQAGDVQVHRLEAVRVGRAELMAAAARHPDHERDPDLAVEHVGDRRGVVDDLVEGEQREVDRHQLDDRPQPAHRGADAGADDRVLGDRHVADAALAELLHQALGDLESALEDADVLAQQQDRLVPLHLLAERGVERLPHPHRRHQPIPPGPCWRLCSDCSEASASIESSSSACA